MRNPLLLLVLLFLGCCFQLSAQTEFELDPNQSMLMFGKGPGQDATKNPFEGEDCFAVVKNLGNVEFSIRIQQKGEVIETIPIRKEEIKTVKLLVGYDLYLDTKSGDKAYASIEYKKK